MLLQWQCHGGSRKTCLCTNLLTFFSFQRQCGVDPELRSLRPAPAAARPQRVPVHGGGGRARGAPPGH